MPTCPQCRAKYPDGVEVCETDGSKLLPDEACKKFDDDLPSGTEVGEYRIEEKIGEGGFGKVYRAVHPVIGKQAAVKVLNQQFSSNPTVVARFVAEARSVNQIRHRHIIDIFSFGTLPDGQQYFVMELLDGITFDKYLKQHGPLAPEQALSILRNIGRALDAAHAADVVHRDLKPENVFLSFDEDGGCHPKLLDFGIAKLLDEQSTEYRTRTGTPMGTPYYMSPEQCRGRGVDHRTDVYSFGAMTHEVLTGQRPFVGESMMDLMFKHAKEDPPTMSSTRPGLPAELDGPVLRMLAKDPNDRPQKLAEAVAELHQAAREAGFDVPEVASTTLGTSSQQGVKRISLGAEDLGSSTADTVQADPRGASGTLGSLQADVPASQAGRSSSGKTLLIGGAAAVVGAIIVWFVTQSGTDPPGEAPATNKAARTATAATVPSGKAATAETATNTDSVATASMIKITVKSALKGLKISRDGKTIGDSSEPLMVPRGETAVSLTFSKPGYAPKVVNLTPNRDQELPVTLVSTAKKTQPPPAKPTGKTPAVPTDLADPFK